MFKFIIAALISLGVMFQATDNTQHHGHHRDPNRAELRELSQARQSSGLKCHLEWDGPAYPGYEAICG